MKRLFPILLCFILVFNISVVSVHAESTSSSWPAAFDMVQQAGESMIEFTQRVSQSAINQIADPNVRQRLKVIDTICGSGGCGIAWLMHQKNNGVSYDTACDTIINDVTQSNGTWLADNATATFIENYYDNTNGVQNGTGGSLDDLGYVYRYLPNYQYFNPSFCTTRGLYNSITTLMKGNPDYIFFIYSRSSASHGAYSEFDVYCRKGLMASGVLSRDYWGRQAYRTDYYNDNWENMPNDELDDGTFAVLRLCASVHEDNTLLELYNEGSWTTLGDIPSGDFEDLNLDELSTTSNNGIKFNYGTSYDQISTMQSYYVNNNSTLLGDTIYVGTSSPLALPVFNSIYDMRKGTMGLKTTNALLPSYTANGPNMSGVTAQQVQQADEIINNYYSPSSNSPGSGGNGNGGNGSGDNGSGSGSGIWDTLANAINGLLTVLGGLISGLVSGLTEVLTSLGGFFTGVLDLANDGVLGLFQAFFPFVPSEWFTVVGLAIGVAFLVFIIKVFKG